MAVLLVVEDDSGVRTSFARALAHGGYTVLEAGSVFQGVQIGTERRPDLLVLDLKLPDGSGLDVLQLLNKRYPGVGSIVVTGFGEIPTALVAGRLGVDQYLEKPVSMGVLLTAVRTALARAGFGPWATMSRSTASSGPVPVFGRCAGRYSIWPRPITPC